MSHLPRIDDDRIELILLKILARHINDRQSRTLYLWVGFKKNRGVKLLVRLNTGVNTIDWSSRVPLSRYRKRLALYYFENSW